jgi:hypothetical protein
MWRFLSRHQLWGKAESERMKKATPSPCRVPSVLLSKSCRLLSKLCDIVQNPVIFIVADLIRQLSLQIKTSTQQFHFGEVKLIALIQHGKLQFTCRMVTGQTMAILASISMAIKHWKLRNNTKRITFERHGYVNAAWTQQLKHYLRDSRREYGVPSTEYEVPSTEYGVDHFVLRTPYYETASGFLNPNP